MTPQQLRDLVAGLPDGAMVTLAKADLVELVQHLDHVLPMLQPAPPAANGNGKALLTAKDVAARLSTGTRYVYACAATWPFTRHVGRHVRFDAAGLERWLSRTGVP